MPEETTYKGEITLKGYTPFKWQRDVHEGIEKAPKDTTHVVLAKRQIGKSTLILNEILRFAVTHKTANVMCVSPSFQQAGKLYEDCKTAVQPTVVYGKCNDTKLEITLKNRAKIMFKSAGSGDNLRGNTVDFLCVDECAFIEDSIFYGILLPMTNVRKAKRLLVSTPKFETGFFYKYYEQGLAHKNGSGWNAYKKVFLYNWNDYDTTAMLSNEKLAELRELLPRLEFENEYMGQFLKSDSTTFGNFYGCVIENKENTHKGNFYVFGVDLATGANNDSTAISIWNDWGEMVDIVHFNDKDTLQTLKVLDELIEQYKPQKICVEYNSIGHTYFDLLKQRLLVYPFCQLLKFNTTNTSKQALVNEFQLAIQNDTIKWAQNTEFALQLQNFGVHQTSTGKITYSANGNGHDDLVMAAMIGYHTLIGRNNQYQII